MHTRRPTQRAADDRAKGVTRTISYYTFQFSQSIISLTRPDESRRLREPGPGWEGVLGGWVVGVKSARKLGREPRAKNVLEAATALLPALRASKALLETV